MKRRLLALLLGLALSTAAHAADPVDNPELTGIFQQDQADREGNIDWTQVGPRDASRRERVRTLLATANVRTSQDYYHAAMVFQHGDSLEDYRLAHALATLAMALDDSKHNRWLVGASWDRLLMRQLQPQWYGTQYKGDARGMYLYPVAEDAVADAERQRMVGHTLAESRAHVAEAAREMGLPERKDPPGLEQLRKEAAAAEDH